jgi:hypothetical protein
MEKPLKLLQDMKTAILAGDWTDVCKAYNKITGENIQPPVEIKVFDSKTAKKRELYEWLTGRREMDEYKKYTTAELRELAETFEMLEIAQCHIEEAEMASEEPNDAPPYSKSSSVPPATSSFYISGKDMTLGDKKLAEAAIQIPDSIQKKLGMDDPDSFTPQPSLRPAFSLEKATCLVCNKECMTRPENISNITGVASTTCEQCMGTRRS